MSTDLLRPRDRMGNFCEWFTSYLEASTLFGSYHLRLESMEEQRDIMSMEHVFYMVFQFRSGDRGSYIHRISYAIVENLPFHSWMPRLSELVCNQLQNDESFMDKVREPALGFGERRASNVDGRFRIVQNAIPPQARANPLPPNHPQHVTVIGTHTITEFDAIWRGHDVPTKVNVTPPPPPGLRRIRGLVEEESSTVRRAKISLRRNHQPESGEKNETDDGARHDVDGDDPEPRVRRAKLFGA